jgi:hypothetical protein
MDQKGSQNGMDELEVIDADSQKVAAMLTALPRVEAPANFEFAVKAGIAKGSPSRSAFWPFLKTAAPLAMIVVVVGLGLLYYQRPDGAEVGVSSNPPVSNPALAPAQTEPAPAPSLTMTAPPQETPPDQTQRASADRDRTVPTRRTTSSSSNTGARGGSVDRILHAGNVIMPPGTESANPRNRNANTATAAMTDMPVREVLNMFGVEGDFADGGWKVKSVKANSLGSRTKIAAGDVIESVDGQPVENDTKLKGGVKTFTVRRDGKVITLTSGN